MRKFKIILFVVLIASFVGLLGGRLVYAAADQGVPSDAPLKQDIQDTDHVINKLKQEMADLRAQIEEGQKDQQQQSEKIRQLEDASQ